MAEYGGYLQWRRGILGHIKHKQLSFPLEYGVYNVLATLADFETGICRACARTIATECGYDYKKIKDTLRRLKRKRYINYKVKNGAWESYDILIDKFEISSGPHAGTRLNAWKHNGSVIPEYVETQSPLSRRFVAASVAASDPANAIEIKDLDDSEKHAVAASVAASSPLRRRLGHINNKEEELKKERSKTPNSRGDSPTTFKLAQEIIRHLQLVDTPTLNRAIQAAIACAASRRSVDLPGGAEYLKCCAQAAHQRGARVNHLWFVDADGWELPGPEKKSNGSERMSAQERRTANNIAVHREWCRQEGKIDPDGQNGNFTTFNYAGRNARVQPKALLPQGVR